MFVGLCPRWACVSLGLRTWLSLQLARPSQRVLVGLHRLMSCDSPTRRRWVLMLLGLSAQVSRQPGTVDVVYPPGPQPAVGVDVTSGVARPTFADVGY